MRMAFFVSWIAAVLLSGCAAPQGGWMSLPPVGLAPEGRLEPSVPELPPVRWSGTQFGDVPVPEEFALDYDASYVNVSGQERRVRVADLRYTGNPSPTEALSNVQGGMSRSGWNLVSLTGVSIKSLRFIKNEEECQIIIREGDAGDTVVVIRLHPLPQ